MGRSDATSFRFGEVRISQLAGTARYAWVILAATFLVGLVVGGLGRFGYSLVLPSIRDDLGLSYALSGLLATANFAGYFVAAFGGGLLSARLGVRGATVAGLLVMLIGWAASALAPGYPVLLALQVPVGFGTGTVMIAAISSLPAWFPVRYRGLVSGLGNGAAGLGILLSGALVPWLLAQFGPTGWRQVWLVFAAAVGVATVVAAVFLRRRVTTGPRPPAGARRIPVGALYRNLTYWRFGSVTFVMGATTAVYGTYFGAYGTLQLGLPADQVGRTWGLVGLLSLLSGILWGIVSDRTGRRAALGTVFLVQAAANAAILVSPGPVTLTISAAVAGLTLFGGAAVMTALMSDLVEPDLLPAVGGLLAIGFGSGQLGGPALAGVLADLTDTLGSAYVLAGLVNLIGVAAVLTLPKVRHHPVGATLPVPTPGGASPPVDAHIPVTPPGVDRDPEPSRAISPGWLALALATERRLAVTLAEWARLTRDPTLAECFEIAGARARDRAFRLRRAFGEPPAPDGLPSPGCPAPEPAVEATDLDRLRFILDIPSPYAGLRPEPPAVPAGSALIAALRESAEEMRALLLEQRDRLATATGHGAVRLLDAEPAQSLDAGRAFRRDLSPGDGAVPAVAEVFQAPGVTVTAAPSPIRRWIIPLAGRGRCRWDAGDPIPLAPERAVEIDAGVAVRIEADGWPLSYLIVQGGPIPPLRAEPDAPGSAHPAARPWSSTR